MWEKRFEVMSFGADSPPDSKALLDVSWWMNICKKQWLNQRELDIFTTSEIQSLEI